MSQSNPSQTVKSSPIKKSAQGSNAFASKLVPTDTRKKELVREMRGSFVGPMPVMEFLDEFLPKVKDLPEELNIEDHFKTMPVCTTHEKHMYEPFIRLVHADPKSNRPSMIPKFKLVNTSNNTDRNSDVYGKVKPDLNIYPEDADVSVDITQMDKTVMDLEFKPRPIHDPFVDQTIFGRNSARSDKDVPLEAAAIPRIECRGQIINYATEIHRRQHRCHSFSLLITGQYARFLRWDRTGGVVSQRFDYMANAIPLIEYLWRFAHLTDVQRGLDCTVTAASPEEIDIAHRLLDRWRHKFVGKPILRVEVPDGKDTRPCVIWGVFSEANSPTGRATRGYPAVDLTTKKVVFVKDTWRPDNDLVDKESQTLKILNDAKVSHIPTFICGDDIPGQRTRTQEFINNAWGRVQDPGKQQFIPRIHHRFIEDAVGRPLDDFKSSKEFMQAMCDAFIAHQEAVEKCRILHRDISAGNILITDEGRGLLIDWDLARSIDEIAKGPRLPQRTGTWQFMSIRLLTNPDKVHEIQDDLESFFYVVLYHALRYMKHTRLNTVEFMMASLFDDMHVEAADKDPIGGVWKSSMVTFGRFLNAGFHFDCQPMMTWVSTVRLYVREWLVSTDTSANELQTNNKLEPITSVDTASLSLHDHCAMRDLFKKILLSTEWPEGDDAVDYLPRAPTPQKRSQCNDQADDGSRPSKKSRSSLIQTSAPR